MFGTALGHKLGAHAGLVGWEGVRLRFTRPRVIVTAKLLRTEWVVAKMDVNSLVIAQLDERIKTLETLIANEESRTYFLDLAKKSLSDATNFNKSFPPRLTEFM